MATLASSNGVHNTEQTNAMSVTPFLRRLHVSIFARGKGSSYSGSALYDVWCDGLPTSPRAAFEMQKSCMCIPGPSTLRLWNLSRDTRNLLADSRLQVHVEAGWQNTSMTQIFRGDVLNVWTERSGPDLITTMSVLSGSRAISEAVVSKRYAPRTDLITVLQDICSNIEGVVLSPPSADWSNGKQLGSRGFTFAGSAREALTSLSEEYGFSWSIADNQLIITPDLYNLPDAFELDAAAGLISVMPITAGVLQMYVGVRISSLFIPTVQVGNAVKLSSSISDKFNRPLTVYSINATLDPGGSAWNMTMENRFVFS